MRRIRALTLVIALVLIAGGCGPGSKWTKVVDPDGFCGHSGVELAGLPAPEDYDGTGDLLKDTFVPVQCAHSGDRSGPSWVEVYSGASSRERPELIEPLARPASVDKGSWTSGIWLQGGCLRFDDSTVTLHGRSHAEDDAAGEFSFFASQSFTWQRDHFEARKMAVLKPPDGTESTPPMCRFSGRAPVALGKLVVVERAGQELKIVVDAHRKDLGDEALCYDVTIDVRRGEWTFSNRQITYWSANGTAAHSDSDPKKQTRLFPGGRKGPWTMEFGQAAAGAAITIADPNGGGIIGTWRLYQ